MANLVHRERGGAIDFNGDNHPDAYVHEIVTRQVSATINPKEDGAVGKILLMSLATLISRPIHTLKEFWGWACLIIAVIYVVIAWFSSKSVIPETRNFADNFRPDVVGAAFGRTGKAVTTSFADSANASEVLPTSGSLSRKTTVKVD
jgi:hypothetical protein